MEIEIKSRTIEFAAKILEDIFSEDAPNLAVEISAHKEKGVTLSAGYAGCCVTLPLATARVIEPGFGVANLGGLLAAFLALPRGEIAVATDSKPGMIVFGSGVRMRLDMPVGTVTRPCGVVLRGSERCAVVDTSALLNAIAERSGNVHIFWPKHPVLSFKPLVLTFDDDLAINEVIAPMREI